MLNGMRGINSTDRQLQWAVILLAAAVILPTVCLLWFMNQAVKNERLVVRQKLTDSYKGQMDLLGRQIEDRWKSRLAVVDTIANLNVSPAAAFAALANASDKSDKNTPICCGVLIFDLNGGLLYPIKDHQSEFDQKPPAELGEAWNAEFVENNPSRAAGLYSRAEDIYSGSYLGRLAGLGKIRCLKKAGEINEAVNQCLRFVRVGENEILDGASALLVAQGRLLLISLRKDSPQGVSKTDYEWLLGWATNYSGKTSEGFLPLASQSRIFFLSKVIELVNEGPFAKDLKDKTALAEKLLYAEQIASSAIENLGGGVPADTLSKENISSLSASLQGMLELVDSNDWPQRLKIDTNQAKELLAAVKDTNAVSEMMMKLQAAAPDRAAAVLSGPKDRIKNIGTVQGKAGYGLFHSVSDRMFLLVITSEQLDADFKLLQNELDRIGLSYNIKDDSGNYVTGAKSSDAPFVTVSAEGYFNGWKISLYPAQSNIFERAADRQIAMYVWTSILVIGLILLAGALAARAVGRQIRLNAMKNNFIATVSHELKTPLASMRVLVDTLLEGNYKNENTVTEYLQLISKENIRLSNLIDNFLSFSRMERNKQAFEMVPTSPVEIVNAAAEAVQSKFERTEVLFDVEVAKSLAMIEADRDAMITVLVNLLDNSYKYSGQDKKIQLGVFEKDGYVCFSVKDNGVGIPHRAIKKIFDRFYQVDTKLSRKSEGCGLGLSIVKFIVDAHKGKIDVESRPDKGTIFTVKLPAERIGQ